MATTYITHSPNINNEKKKVENVLGEILTVFTANHKCIANDEHRFRSLQTKRQYDRLQVARY